MNALNNLIFFGALALIWYVLNLVPPAKPRTRK